MKLILIVQSPIQQSNMTNHILKTNKQKLNPLNIKIKLDISLLYYSDFIFVVNAIVLADYEGLVDSINNLNKNDIKVVYNEKSLTEQLHFDLSTENGNGIDEKDSKRIIDLPDLCQYLPRQTCQTNRLC